MRVEQIVGMRGSLKSIQRLVELRPQSLDGSLRDTGALAAGRTLHWLSPLPSDDRAEYRDAQWLERIGCPELEAALATFWPRRGPQWDALATDGAGRRFLFEAKAHAAEMGSSCQAGQTSRATIARALEGTKVALGADTSADWMTGYYQYANRLAHLRFLREAGVDAWLVFLYFTGDDDMRGPSDVEAWGQHLEAARTHLGLTSNVAGVVTLFPSISDLA